MYRGFPVVHVAAASKNRVIGIQGKLPWHIPEDLKFFREMTLNCVCIMGRKTFDSIGRKPLPKRLNIVVSRSALAETASVANVRVVKSLEEALDLAASEIENSGLDLKWRPEIMIIGGGEIYRQSLSWTDKIYLTEVEIELDGDAFFPELPAEFNETHRDARSGNPDYAFVTYEK
ncbi:MAG: dihydrofolate reductase [Bdellovibrionales bacterium]|nr:dihydrofolate reductase [Bdellovibrionales bacterium]